MDDKREDEKNNREWDYEPGAYAILERHLRRIEKVVSWRAEDTAFERTPEGRIVVTKSDIQEAIDGSWEM